MFPFPDKVPANIGMSIILHYQEIVTPDVILNHCLVFV